MKLPIREHRERLKLTQLELAKMAGRSFRTIQSWERGESYPNAEYVWKLCEIFGTDPNTFLGWNDEHPDDTNGTPLNSHEKALIADYRACSPVWMANISMTAQAAAGQSREEAEHNSDAAANLSNTA